MKIAVLTIFTPATEKYLKEYTKCINRQSNQDFDLVIVDNSFPGDLAEFTKTMGIKVRIIESNQSVQENRLVGLNHCKKLGFDVIICSNADEVMQFDRIEKVKDYFKSNARKHMLFVNPVARKDSLTFDLNYKPMLTLADLLDFNVLAYGAMNLKTKMIPFIMKSKNERIQAFDWWLALQFLVQYPSVDFREDIQNNYIGDTSDRAVPVFEVTIETIEKSLRVKQNIYAEMGAYCAMAGLDNEADMFREKTSEIENINDYIEKNSMAKYFKHVKKYLEEKKKIYLWQEAVSLSELKIKI